MISQMNIPTIFTQVEFFYSLACYTVILSGTFCAIVRWCHMCHPFDKQGDYFYPARRQMTFFYAATALQLPYVLCPADSGTWFFARSFGILYYPVCFAMLYHRYSKWERCGERCRPSSISSPLSCCSEVCSPLWFSMRRRSFCPTNCNGNVS